MPSTDLARVHFGALRGFVWVNLDPENVRGTAVPRIDVDTTRINDNKMENHAPPIAAASCHGCVGRDSPTRNPEEPIRECGDYRTRYRYPCACNSNNSAYRPFRASSSSCVPIESTAPSFSTRIRSAMRTLEKRCEISILVRPALSALKR